MKISKDALLTFTSLLDRSGKSALSKLFNQSGVKSYIFYSHGRIALLDGLKLLDCKEGTNVLIPSYFCAVATESLYELGIEARFYNISMNLEPDIKDILSKIDTRTKAILVVDYFGFPAPLQEIRNICRQNRIFLIEDAAHGFLSRSDSHLLGTLGDIGFSSFWKELPIPNGAVLFINNHELIPSDNLEKLYATYNQLPKTDKKSTFTYVLNSLVNNLESRYGLQTTLIRNVYRKLFPENYGRTSKEWFQLSKVRISDFSRRIADNTDFDHVYLKRRANYQFWLNELGERQNVHIIFRDLPEGVCPQYFVVVIKDTSTFLGEMLNRGIDVTTWPSKLPKEVKNNTVFQTANYLAEHLVVLPVHQSLIQDHLKRALNSKST